jgi:hypothetical protein
MPVFEVAVEETYDQTIEEFYRAYRTMTVRRVYRVEAEDEDTAGELAKDASYENIDRTEFLELLDEDEDYGDIYDSEWYDSGDVLGEEYVETNIEVEEWASVPEPAVWRGTRYYRSRPEPEWRI